MSNSHQTQKAVVNGQLTSAVVPNPNLDNQWIHVSVRHTFKKVDGFRVEYDDGIASGLGCKTIVTLDVENPVTSAQTESPPITLGFQSKSGGEDLTVSVKAVDIANQQLGNIIKVTQYEGSSDDIEVNTGPGIG